MSDLTTENIKNNKIKVRSAEIVVYGTADKPYYEIKYYDIADGKYHIGYSSYDIHNVFEWLKECFEIAEEKSTTNAKSDLISRSALRQEILDKMPQSSARGVFLAFVDEQPSAYDKDKVVEQLEELSECAYDMKGVLERNQGEIDEIIYQAGKEYAYDDAIEIVKGGGVE